MGLPRYIAEALETPDLSPGDESRARRDLVLGADGQKQFIPELRSDDCGGSGGCNWKILDDDTQQELLPDSQGMLFKTQRITNGYYDIVVVFGTAVDEYLYAYKYHVGQYKPTTCYERKIDPDGPAVLIPCMSQ